MKQSNHHFSFTIAVKNTREKVWEVLTDVQSWHIWDTEILEAKLDGGFVVGAKGTMTPKSGPKLKFYISEIEPNKSYTFNTIMPVGKLVIKRTLNTVKNEIEFTDDIQFAGFLKYVFGLMLGGQFRRVLPDVMLKFKNLAESK